MQNITKALLTLLNKGIVNFTYRKVDGTIRNAVGTRNLCLACQALGLSIPMPKTGRNNPTAYYDIEKNAWRSFVAENVLSINGVGITEIKGIKDDRIVPVGSLEDVDIPINVGGGIGVGMGFGGGIPKEEIHKAIEELDKDIEIPIVKGGFGMGKPIGESVAVPFGDGKGMVFTPLAVGKEHTTLPIGGMSIEDFAKLVAKYVVAEFTDRLMR